MSFLAVSRHSSASPVFLSMSNRGLTSSLETTAVDVLFLFIKDSGYWTSRFGGVSVRDVRQQVSRRFCRVSLRGDGFGGSICCRFGWFNLRRGFEVSSDSLRRGARISRAFFSAAHAVPARWLQAGRSRRRIFCGEFLSYDIFAA